MNEMLQIQFATHTLLENRQRVAWEVNYVIAMIVESWNDAKENAINYSDKIRHTPGKRYSVPTIVS
jgi:hypothetical protein